MSRCLGGQHRQQPCVQGCIGPTQGSSESAVDTFVHQFPEAFHAQVIDPLREIARGYRKLFHDDPSTLADPAVGLATFLLAGFRSPNVTDEQIQGLFAQLRKGLKEHPEIVQTLGLDRPSVRDQFGILGLLIATHRKASGEKSSESRAMVEGFDRRELGPDVMTTFALKET